MAVDILIKNGLIILERNFRCRHGEIDIIAREGDMIVFIEVKTRKSDRFGVPEEAVDRRKQAKLRQLAAYYLNKNFYAFRCRFDVYSIYLDHNNQPEDIRVLRNCF